MKNLFIIILLAFGSLLNAQETIDLFILAGQSNARGHRGNAAYYPADTDGLDSQIRLNYTWHNLSSSNGWTTLKPQKKMFPDGHFGPEVTFSRALKIAGYNPAIFKYTAGGSSIHGDWMTPGDGMLYDSVAVALNKAIVELTDQGHTVNIKGFIWIQGESDGAPEDTIEDAQLYQSRLQSIIDDIRNIAGNDSLPVLLGVKEQYVIQGKPQALNGHANIARADDNIRFVTFHDYPHADKYHLTPQGIEEHGKRLYRNYQLIVNQEQEFNNCTFEITPNTVSTISKSSWGQTFKMDCSGYLDRFSFEAGSDITAPFTVTIGNGGDCNADVLYTKKISGIVDGKNEIDINEKNIYLDKEHTYYLNIVADNGELWKTRYVNSDKMIGNLKTYNTGEDPETCWRNFFRYNSSLNYDMGISATTSLASPMNSTTLPIVLESFDVKSKSSNAVLNWATSNEINNNHFNIQRSTDGIFFETIATVDGKDNTQSISEYTYTDLNIGDQYSLVYYRLEQVDYDGSEETFTAKPVSFSNTSIAVFPNPVSKGEHITIKADKIKLVEVHNFLGERIISTSHNNESFINLPTESLSSGFYLIIINNESVHKLYVE